MIAIAHFIAITCYIGAAALAAAPFARPLPAPVRGVLALLGAGIVAHAAGLIAIAREASAAPMTGIGPALSFAGLSVAVVLLLAEVIAHEVSLTLAAAPLAALCATMGNIIGLRPLLEPTGTQGWWLVSHIALSFIGIAGFATAAAAGTMYLVERRELRARRFGAIFRFFPPLETLDRLNHFASITGWLSLTLGVALAISYARAYPTMDAFKLVWALAAWVALSAVALGQLAGWWRARRAAIAASVAFAFIVALYLVFRVSAPAAGRFL